MPLRFDLAPFEKLHIGRSVLTNYDGRTQFTLDGDTPVLRAKDVLDAGRAGSPIERLYVCVQQMYLEEDAAKYQGAYLSMAAQSMSADPAVASDLQAVERLLTDGDLYKALKLLKRLLPPALFAVVHEEPASYKPRGRRSGSSSTG